MELKNLIHYFCLSLFLVTGSLFVTSCNIFDEDLPECRLYVKFKYDYNMLFTDAFHTQVDKVELYVFDKEGKFLFMQSEEGDVLATGSCPSDSIGFLHGWVYTSRTTSLHPEVAMIW